MSVDPGETAATRRDEEVMLAQDEADTRDRHAGRDWKVETIDLVTHGLSVKYDGRLLDPRRVVLTRVVPADQAAGEGEPS